MTLTSSTASAGPERIVGSGPMPCREAGQVDPLSETLRARSIEIQISGALLTVVAVLAATGAIDRFIPVGARPGQGFVGTRIVLVLALCLLNALAFIPKPARGVAGAIRIGRISTGAGALLVGFGGALLIGLARVTWGAIHDVGFRSPWIGDAGEPSILAWSTVVLAVSAFVARLARQRATRLVTPGPLHGLSIVLFGLGSLLSMPIHYATAGRGGVGDAGVGACWSIANMYGLACGAGMFLGIGALGWRCRSAQWRASGTGGAVASTEAVGDQAPQVTDGLKKSGALVLTLATFCAIVTLPSAVIWTRMSAKQARLALAVAFGGKLLSGNGATEEISLPIDEGVRTRVLHLTSSRIEGVHAEPDPATKKTRDSGYRVRAALVEHPLAWYQSEQWRTEFLVWIDSKASADADRWSTSRVEYNDGSWVRSDSNTSTHIQKDALGDLGVSQEELNAPGVRDPKIIESTRVRVLWNRFGSLANGVGARDVNLFGLKIAVPIALAGQVAALLCLYAAVSVVMLLRRSLSAAKPVLPSSWMPTVVDGMGLRTVGWFMTLAVCLAPLIAASLALFDTLWRSRAAIGIWGAMEPTLTMAFLTCLIAAAAVLSVGAFRLIVRATPVSQR